MKLGFFSLVPPTLPYDWVRANQGQQSGVLTHGDVKALNWEKLQKVDARRVLGEGPHGKKVEW